MLRKFKILLISIVIAFSLVFFVSAVEADIIYYNFTNTTNNKAFWKNTDTKTTAPPAWTACWDGAEVSSGAYTNMTTDDQVYWELSGGAQNSEPFTRFNFTINENIGTINWIYVAIDLRKKGTTDEDCAFIIANFSDSAWQEFAARATSTTEDTLGSKNFTSGFSHIISSANQLVLLVEGIDQEAADGCRIDFVEVRVNAIAPTYSSPAINDTEVFINEAVNHTINITAAPDGYIFSWNGTNGCTGGWQNSSWIDISGSSVIAWNVSTPTTGCGGKTVGWKIYANNTVGWSVSAEQTYFVYKYGTLEVDWTTGSPINDTDCTEGSPCEFYQYDIFTANATVTCAGGTGAKCGYVYGGIRYNVSTDPNTLISTTEGATPFYILTDFTRVGAISLESGENYLLSSVIDTANGFAYFGTLPIPGKVVKINLAGFTRVGAISLESGEGNLRSAVIDTANGFAYFGTYTVPGKIVKINLTDFTRVGAITLESGENELRSAVIDTSNGYAYFGTNTDPGKVIKINLTDFTRVGAITLESGENKLHSAVIDTANGFAYFGTYTYPQVNVIKINLTDFTRVGAVSLESGENYLLSSVIDTANGFAYFGPLPIPGKIVKINLTDFTKVGSLESGEGNLRSAVIDTANGFAYFGTDNEAGKIVKINLTDFTKVGSLESGEINLASAVIDTANGFAYFGTATEPGKVAKIAIGKNNPKPCGILTDSESCQLNFTINGTEERTSKIDVNFTSSLGSSLVADNDTEDAIVKIIAPAIITSFKLEMLNTACALVNYTSNTTPPGNVTSEIEFNFTWVPQDNVEPCIVGSGGSCCQNETHAIWKFYNTGNTNVDWWIQLNESVIGINVTFSNDTYSPDVYDFAETGWNLIGPNIGQGGTKNCWLWADVAADTSPETYPRQFEHNATQAA